MSTLAQAIRAAAAKADCDIEDDIAIPEAPLSIPLLRSAAFRVLTKSAHLALALIAIEVCNGRNDITHWEFQSFGIPRDSIVFAVAELEALGFISVQRLGGRNANTFDLASKWRRITSVEQAVAVRDRARRFGIIRRRKVERETARLARARLLEQLAEALNAPASAPALADLDDTELKTLDAIITVIANRTPVTYTVLRERIAISNNRLAKALRTLAGRGLIEISRGKRQRNVYRLASSLPLQHEHASS